MLEQQLINACIDEPSLIFKFINKGYFKVIERMIDENKINVNLVDGLGNDVVTRLLKAKQYDLVEKLMKKKNWDVNHKNIDGNTFGHILAYDNSLYAIKVVELLNKKKNFSPNIKNNKGETSFDRAISNNYLCTALKFFKDKKFTSFNLDSFKNVYNTILKNNEYGKYTKIDTLEVILDNFEYKDVDPILMQVLDGIDKNFTQIKNDILNNDYRKLDNLMSNV